MDIRETVQKLLQEMVMPDLGKIKEENGKILTMLDLTIKRLDDVNTHLADQSRRIDEVRSELSQRIDDFNSELGRKIDDVHSELLSRIGEVQSDLVHRIDANNARIDLFFQSHDHEKLEN